METGTNSTGFSGHLERSTDDDSAAHHEFLYHKRLDWNHQEIRLLRIMPSDLENGLVQLQLKYSSLRDTPNYRALSYVWGDPKVTNPVVLDGKEVQVTINLEAALREIQRSVVADCHDLVANEVLFWIDALCINQQDNVEKGDQVQHMDAIYRQASSVSIWLGEADEETSMAFADLRFLASLAIKEGIRTNVDILQSYKIDKRDQALLRILEQYMGEGKDHWAAVDRLFRRSWWRRAWVVQEAILARVATVLCGTERLEWPIIIAFLCLTRLIVLRGRDLQRASSPDAFDKAGRRMIELDKCGVHHFKSLTDKAYTLTHLFQALNGVVAGGKLLQTTDSRDRIYSISSLIEEPRRSAIPIRYDNEWTTTMLYMRVTLLILEESGFLNLTSARGYRPGSQKDMPYWILDWDNITTYISAPENTSWSACGDLEFTGKHFRGEPSTKSLYIQALPLDRIQASGPAFDSPFYSIELDTEDSKAQARTEFKSTLREWILHVKNMLVSVADSPYSSPDMMEDAIMRTCMVGQESNQEVHEAYLALMHDSPSTDEMTSTGKFSACLPFLYKISRLRFLTPFVTSKGYLGLTYAPVSPGVDTRLWILPGANTPFALRKGSDSRWELLGNAYVHGIMNGEFANSSDQKLDWIELS